MQHPFTVNFAKDTLLLKFHAIRGSMFLKFLSCWKGGGTSHCVDNTGDFFKRRMKETFF